jgi:hypothetical protein
MPFIYLTDIPEQHSFMAASKVLGEESVQQQQDPK